MKRAAFSFQLLLRTLFILLLLFLLRPECLIFIELKLLVLQVHASHYLVQPLAFDFSVCDNKLSAFKIYPNSFTVVLHLLT